MGDPFIDDCKRVSHQWRMMTAIPFVENGSMREGNWRWFPSSLGHPWVNSKRQVA